jgi:hypothetical protein
LTLVVVNVLINIYIIIFGFFGFVIFLGLVAYGATLEQKNYDLEQKNYILEREKEKQT